MTLWQSPLGSAETLRVVLGTSLTPIIPEVGNLTPVAKIHICNVSAGAVTLDLAVTDGTSTFYLEKGRSIAVGGTYELHDELLQKGSSLVALGSVGDALHVSAIRALSFR